MVHDRRNYVRVSCSVVESCANDRSGGYRFPDHRDNSLIHLAIKHIYFPAREHHSPDTHRVGPSNAFGNRGCVVGIIDGYTILTDLNVQL